jgi:hypothetical protein
MFSTLSDEREALAMVAYRILSHSLSHALYHD